MASHGVPLLPLAERLRPRRLSDMVGNARPREELRSWGERWREGVPARRAALLAGPPGVGKTTAALALAEEFGWTVVEMNASDARNQGTIERVAGRASITHTLEGSDRGTGPRRSLILLDEADCLTGRATESAHAPRDPVGLREFLQGRYGSIEALNSAWGLGSPAGPRPFAAWVSVPRTPGNAAWGRLPTARKDLEEWRATGASRDLSDRGGLGAIARLVRSTRQPVVLTVNDERPLSRYSPVFRTAVLRLRFGPAREEEVRGLLDRVARSEQIALADGVVGAIAKRSGGDVRAALNDLDAVSPLPPGPLQLEVLGGRDLESDFAAFTEEVLSRPRFYRAAEVRDRLDAPPDDLLPWIEENLVRFAPDPSHRAAGFRPLLVADRFLVRARRFRTWGLWSYASELLAGGVGLALRETPGPAHAAAFPEFLGEMGRTKAMRAVRTSVTGKIGARAHLSRDKARLLLLPLLEGILSPPRGRRPDLVAKGRDVAREFAFGSEEVAYLLRVSPDDHRVVEMAGGADDERGLDEEEPAQPLEQDSLAPPPASPDRGNPKRPTQKRLGEYGP